MSQKNKPKRERYVSPRGTAIWPRLNAPDTKFKEDGEFSVKLAFDGDDNDAKALVKKLEKLRDEAFAKFISENPKKKKVAKAAPIAKDELDDDGEETGRFTLNFKMRHKIKAKATGKVYTLWPTIIDAKKNVLKNPPNIGGGSEMKVSFEVNPAFVESSKEFHLSLRLVAVQLLKLVEFGGAASAAKDFDEEDDGYEGDDSAAEEAEDGDGEEADGDAGDDGDGDY